MSDARNKIISTRLTKAEHEFLEELASREYRKPGETLRWLLQRELRLTQRDKRLTRQESTEQPA